MTFVAMTDPLYTLLQGDSASLKTDRFDEELAA